MTLAEQIDALIYLRGDEDGGVSLECKECDQTSDSPLAYWGWSNSAGSRVVEKISELEKVMLDHIYDKHRLS